MPYRLASEKSQIRLTVKLMRASFILPVLTFIVGTLAVLYAGYAFERNDKKERIANLDTIVREYSKQLELTALNSTLRIQSIIDLNSPVLPHIFNLRHAIEASLRHTMFQRVSIYTLQNVDPIDGLPILKRIYISHSPGDELPQPKTQFLESKYIRAKIKVMSNASSRPIAFAISHSEQSDVLILIWRSSQNAKEYALFTAPLHTVFATAPFDPGLSVALTDSDTDLTSKVKWTANGLVRVTSASHLPSESASESSTPNKPILIATNGSAFSTLQMKWFGEATQTLGILTWATWAAGLVIISLFSLLLRFLLDQNRKVADLVIKRTVDLESALDNATEANLAKTRFLANMSHELRTPLNLILGMLEMVEEKSYDSKVLEFIKTIRISGDHLLSMISDLLDVAQKDSQELTVKNVPIKCPMFFEEIARLIGPDCRKKGLAFSFAMSPDIPEYFRGDPARVRQVLINLLRNSIKYTVHGSIRLSVSLIKPHADSLSERITLRMSVNDTGMGIPKAKVKDIFERFLQLESTKILGQGGVGLGLSIVKDLVTRLNGNITVESDEGVGSTFTVDLDFESMSARTWSDAFMPVQVEKREIAVVSNNSLLYDQVRFYLEQGQTKILSLTKDKFESIVRESKVDTYAYYILDLNVGADATLTQIGPMRKRTILVGNEQELSALPLKLRVIDDCPLLPTPLLNAVGVKSLEIRERKDSATTLAPVMPKIEGLPQNLSILVADDDKGNRDLFEAYFASFGWQLTFTENGQEAFNHYVEVSRDHQPDIIIADLRMPIMDGLELTDRVNAFEKEKNLKHTPVILVTADALDETAKLAHEHGVTAFLTKPIRKAKIIDAILAAYLTKP